MAGRKVTSIMLTAAIVASLVATTAVTSSAVTSTTAESNATTDVVNSYGLASNIQDGVILHCFDWKYTDIIAELPNIAKAGFTTLQTSPAQANNNRGTWYWLYQPRGFYVDSNDLGTKAELQNLCSEAKKYGVKVVVDVVANHLEGSHVNIVDDLKPSQYWHHLGNVPKDKWGDRYWVTKGDIGMQDLATENSYVQQVVKKYIEDLKSYGVDGIRFDAAKHIGLPSEGDNFWPTVTSVSGLWYYGEILDNPGGDGPSIMKEYSKYISVTDNGYGSIVRDAFKRGAVPDAIGVWSQQGVAPNRLVYWGESHDTYSNDGDSTYGDGSQYIDDNKIDRAYAVAAARADATSLYFSRPFEKQKESIKGGKKGSTHFTASEVSAVNKFHNAMVGKPDWYSNSNGCAVVTRKNGGAVIVKGSGSGSVSVANGGGYCPAGTYKDQVSGATFTVTSSTISGDIGSSGIAVIYNATEDPTQAPTSAPTQGPTSAPGITYTRGDVNSDGSVNMKDAILTQKAVLGSVTLSEKQKLAADVDSNKSVATSDIINIMRYIVGYANTYEIGKTFSGGEKPTQAPTSAPVGERTVYFDGSAIATGTERWVVYTWGTGTTGEFIEMSGSGSGSSFAVKLPDNRDNFIICRMNGGTSSNSWDNCWNQSEDLKYSSGNSVKATGWGSGNKFTTSQSNK